MTPEAEDRLDEAACRIYNQMEALLHYASAFFNDVCVAAGLSRGEVGRNFFTGELEFTAFYPNGQRHVGRVARDAYRYFLSKTDQRLYPEANPFSELKMLLSPQWRLEKEAARELARRMTPPSLMQIQKDEERRRAEDVPVFHRPKGRWDL